MLPDTINFPLGWYFKHSTFPSCLSKNFSNNTSSCTENMLMYPCSVPIAICDCASLTSKQNAHWPVTVSLFLYFNSNKSYSTSNPSKLTLNNRSLHQARPSIELFVMSCGICVSTNGALEMFQISILASILQSNARIYKTFFWVLGLLARITWLLQAFLSNGGDSCDIWPLVSASRIVCCVFYATWLLKLMKPKLI